MFGQPYQDPLLNGMRRLGAIHDGAMQGEVYQDASGKNFIYRGSQKFVPDGGDTGGGGWEQQPGTIEPLNYSPQQLQTSLAGFAEADRQAEASSVEDFNQSAMIMAMLATAGVGAAGGFAGAAAGSGTAAGTGAGAVTAESVAASGLGGFGTSAGIGAGEGLAAGAGGGSAFFGSEGGNLLGGAAGDTLGGEALGANLAGSAGGVSEEALLMGGGVGGAAGGVGSGGATGFTGAGSGLFGAGTPNSGLLSGASSLFGGSGGAGGTGTIGNSLLGQGVGAGLNYLTGSALQGQAQDAAAELQRTGNPLNDPQRQQYQGQLSNLMNNPTDFWQTNPAAVGQLDLAKNMFEANSAKMGTGGTQFSDYLKNVTNAASGTYNDQAQLLAGLGGFNMPAQGTNAAGALTQQGLSFANAGNTGLGNFANSLFQTPTQRGTASFNTPTNNTIQTSSNSGSGNIGTNPDGTQFYIT